MPRRWRFLHPWAETLRCGNVLVSEGATQGFVEEMRRAGFEADVPEPVIGHYEACGVSLLDGRRLSSRGAHSARINQRMVEMRLYDLALGLASSTALADTLPARRADLGRHAGLRCRKCGEPVSPVTDPIRGRDSGGTYENGTAEPGCLALSTGLRELSGGADVRRRRASKARIREVIRSGRSGRSGARQTTTSDTSRKT